MTSVKLTAASSLGLAIETTLGTAVAPTAFIPVRNFKPQDNYHYVADQGKRGQIVDMYGQYQGVTSSEYEIDGDFYPTSGGNLLAAFLGQDTVTGSSAPYTHAFKGIASPPSYSLSDNYVANFRQFPGSRCDGLDLNFTPDSGLSYTAHFLGFPSVTGTAPGSLTYGTDPYIMGWQASLNLASSPNTRLNSLRLQLQRVNSQVVFSANNSQKPFDIAIGAVRATWNLSFWMVDDTEYLLALTQATKAVSVTFTQSGTNDQLVLTSSAVQFTQPTIDRGGQFVLVNLSGVSVYNATDNGSFQATLTNEVAGSYSTTAAS